MKRKLAIIITCLSILLVPFYAKSQKRKKQEQPVPKGLNIPGTGFLYAIPSNMDEVKFDYKQMNAPLPKIKIISYKGEEVTKQVLNGSNLILMIFNPTCEHCEDQAALFRDNIFLFKKSRILLVASDQMTSYLEYFNNGLHISDYPTFTVTIDSAKLLNKLFNYEGLPQLNIYSGKDLRLLKTFNNDTPLDSLKKYIE